MAQPFQAATVSGTAPGVDSRFARVRSLFVEQADDEKLSAVEVSKMDAETHSARAAAIEAQFPKICSCCRKSISLQQWLGLAAVGFQRDPDFVVEMKNHECGSTLGIELPAALDVGPWGES